MFRNHDRIVIDSDSDDEELQIFFNQRRKARRLQIRPNLYEELDEDDFFIRFRLTKATVMLILHLINDLLEFPTNRNNSVSPIDQLLLTLRFYATGSFLIVVGDFMGVHKSTASRIVHRVSEAIAGLRETYVRMPNTAEEISALQVAFYRSAAFPRVIGVMDCTHVKILSPGGENAEEFRNRKGYFSFNIQTISDPQLKIMDVVARWPGATHDSTIFNNSTICARFENGNFGSSILLGDSGYPCRSYLIPPLRNPVTRQEQLFNESQIRTRNAVERQYGVWKRRFPILALGIRLKVSSVQAIIVACAILQNIAVEQKEVVPPVEAEHAALVEADIIEGQIPNGRIEGGNEGVRQTLIGYFSNLVN